MNLTSDDLLTTGLHLTHTEDGINHTYNNSGRVRKHKDDREKATAFVKKQKVPDTPENNIVPERHQPRRQDEARVPDGDEQREQLARADLRGLGLGLGPQEPAR